MTKLLLAALVCAALPALAGNDDAQPFSVQLGPGEMHEECVRVEAGTLRTYSWKADERVDFNIHYHRYDPDEVIFPVEHDSIRGESGTFTAKSGEDYCWMWTARLRPARLEGRIDAKK